jgi:hypothetical protein
MEILSQLVILQRKYADLSNSIKTEEATKNAFIMPFLQSVLGYDVFDPKEVVPEYVCDLGIKKGEKIDYAVFNGDQVQMLVECKKCGEDLNVHHASQLFRYFHVTNARIALLTNGRHYWFFTDLEASNKMDEKPFLTLDISDIDEHLLQDLSKLTKSNFNLEAVISTAGELKYISQLKKHLSSQLTAPTDEFVKFFASRVYEGVITQKVRDQFTILLQKSIQQHLSDLLNDRLKAAIKPPSLPSDALNGIVESSRTETPDASSEETPTLADNIQTTALELEGFFAVKSIVRSVISTSRIVHRDAQSYFAIILDDNNRKPVCRLHFNRTKKMIGLFDAEKNELRYPIDSIDDIYKFSTELTETVKRYL